ncbi:MAG: autotransporter domain-containing protein, partial [Rhizobiales bacterium]|nr:autotransporter domain-containing protein [Hyphomicrobiales bacterium]
SDNSTTGSATIVSSRTIALTTTDTTGAATVTLNSGGTLAGYGAVGNTTVNAGGTLMAGLLGTPGTLIVNGNLTFNSGVSYVVQAGPNQFSMVTVNGTAALSGTALVSFASGAYAAGSYAILLATGGLNGTTFSAFDTLGFNSDTMRVRNPHLVYDATHVYLVLDPATIALLASFTKNQTQVATGINAGVLANPTLPAGFNTLLGFTGAQLTGALDQVGGQAATGAASGGIKMMNAFLPLLLNPLSGAPGGNPGALGFARAFGPGERMASPEAAAAYAAVTPKDRRAASIDIDRRWRLWGQGYGGYGKTAGDAIVGSNDVSTHIWGLAAGADYRVMPHTTLGFALAGGNLSWGLSQGLGGGRSDVFQLGAYGSHSFGASYISAAAAYAWHDMTTGRTVTAVGSETLQARFRAQSFGGRLEGGYRFAMPWVGVTPYAAAQIQQFRTPGYSETVLSGTGTFPLSYASNRTNATRFELGSWFDKTFALDNGRALAIRTRAAWAHDHTSDIAMNAVFQTLPGSNFTVNGAPIPANSALLSAGAELRLANNVSIAAKFDGEFASHARTYTGTGSIKYRW